METNQVIFYITTLVILGAVFMLLKWLRFGKVLVALGKILPGLFFFWLSGALLTLGIVSESEKIPNLLFILLSPVSLLIAVGSYHWLCKQNKDEGFLVNLYKNFINQSINRFRKHYLKNYPQPDSEPVHQLMTLFRRNYNDYFKTEAQQDSKINQFNQQNGVLHIVQTNVTQTLWDRLYLHKRRLKQLNIDIDYHIERSAGGFIDFFAKGSRDGELPREKNKENNNKLPFEQRKKPIVQSIIAKCFHEKQLVIYEIFESIKSKVTYRLNGKKIKVFKNNHYAYYEIFNTEAATNQYIHCPNCGAQSGIEGLYDGCDFCGTQFEVDCLGLKVANFSIKKDIRGRFATVERIVHRIIYSIYLLLLWLLVVLLFEGTLISADSNLSSLIQEKGLIDGIIIFALAFVSLMITLYFIPKVGYWVTVLVLRLFSWVLYFFIHHYKKKMNERAYNSHFLQQIKAVDPHFTYNAFYASALEKVMILYFADNPFEIEGIATVPFEHQHHNVIDLLFDEIYITDFYHDNRQMHLTVKIIYQCLTLHNQKITVKKLSHTFGLVKNIADKHDTPVRVLQCHQCGGNLPIISGRLCQFCRSEVNFMDYDWMIEKQK